MTEQERETIQKLLEKTERREIRWERDRDMGGFITTVGNLPHVRIRPELTEVGLDKWKLVGYIAEIETSEGATGLEVWEEGDRTLLSQFHDAAENSVRENNRQFILQLIERTERGEIRWEPDGNARGLSAVADNASHLHLRPWYKGKYESDMTVGGYKLEIQNEQYEKQSETIEEEEGKLLLHLYELARASVERRTIETLRDHLKDI